MERVVLSENLISFSLDGLIDLSVLQPDARWQSSLLAEVAGTESEKIVVDVSTENVTAR